MSSAAVSNMAMLFGDVECRHRLAWLLVANIDCEKLVRFIRELRSDWETVHVFQHDERTSSGTGDTPQASQFCESEGDWRVRCRRPKARFWFTAQQTDFSVDKDVCDKATSSDDEDFCEWCVLDSLGSDQASKENGFKGTCSTKNMASHGVWLFLNICASYLKTKKRNEGEMDGNHFALLVQSPTIR
jgi:hypothetical protein